MKRKAAQLNLPKLAGWGGRRERAGRKRKLGARVTHAVRPLLAHRFPVHVTLRVLPHVWNLRSRRAFREIRAALSQGAERFGMRVCEFSVQGNHAHLLVEAADEVSLSRGMQGLTIRIAKALNRMMDRGGRVFADRFHSRILRSPTEVRSALMYVRHNRAIHRARRGRSATAIVDMFSSLSREHGLVLPRARTWLLRQAVVEPSPPD